VVNKPYQLTQLIDKMPWFICFWYWNWHAKVWVWHHIDKCNWRIL